MKKSIFSIGLTFLLLIHPIFTLNERAFVNSQPKITGFNPEDIELIDDAFHNYKDFNCVEWWYFDANLDDGYSIQIILYVFVIFNYKIAITAYKIFKDGVLVCNKEKFYLKNDFYISIKNPIFIVDEKTVMRGYINKSTGEWVYDLSLEIDDSSIDLQFIGKSKGFKGKLNIGSWAVILPNANVSGKIKVKNIESDVCGYGYHDHNWDMKLRVLINFGWYWGRIIFSNYSIVYYVIMNTRFSYSQMVLVLSNASSYIAIKPEDMAFIPKDFQFENNRLIPHRFEISAKTKKILLQVNLTALWLHHGARTYGIRNYWRYLTDSEGFLNVNSEKTYFIDGEQIAEFWRFR